MTWRDDGGQLDEGQQQNHREGWLGTPKFAVFSIVEEAKGPGADSGYQRGDPGELKPCVSGKPNQRRDSKVHRTPLWEEDL